MSNLKTLSTLCSIQCLKQRIRLSELSSCADIILKIKKKIGIVGLVIGHPMETIKVRQQNYGTALFKTIQRTFKYEGPKGFYKGMALPLCTVGPANALLFGVYGNIMQMQEEAYGRREKTDYTSKSAIKHIFIAGTCGGLFQTVFSCPVELVKTLLQARVGSKSTFKPYYVVPYHGPMDAAKGIWAQKGFKGFFRGLTPLMIRDVPTSGIYILTYEFLIYHLFRHCETPVFIKRVVAGGSAGILSWICVFPLDVIKARMQTDNPMNPQYKSMIDCFVKSYKHDGWHVFFKGFPATLLRTFPVNAAIFIGYEQTLHMFEHLERTIE